MSFVINWNNSYVRSICPICFEEHKPSIGPWVFVEGTWDPVCEECFDKVDSMTLAFYYKLARMQEALLDTARAIDIQRADRSFDPSI